jgi:hypothetical protein
LGQARGAARCSSAQAGGAGRRVPADAAGALLTCWLLPLLHPAPHPLPQPQDTIKVRCQAQGVPARAVLKSLAGLRPDALAAALFAGVGQAALASVLVGAIHFMSFCSAKRAVAGHLEERERKCAAEAAAGSTAAAGAASGWRWWQREDGGGRGDAGEAGGGAQRHHLLVSHGASGSHFTPVDIVEPDVAAVDGGKGGGGGGGHGSAASAAGSSSNIAMTSNLVGDSSTGCGPLPAGDPLASRAGPAARHPPNALPPSAPPAPPPQAAAVIAAVATALVEAPLEMFRHNAQAGTCAAGGNFLGAMWRVMRDARSPLPLYRGLTGGSPGRGGGAAGRGGGRAVCGHGGARDAHACGPQAWKQRLESNKTRPNPPTPQHPSPTPQPTPSRPSPTTCPSSWWWAT